MISTANITMQFGAKPLFENVSVKFGDGNRYGLIGANGCGKSTLHEDPRRRPGAVRGQRDARCPTTASASCARISSPSKSSRVIDTVIMGHEQLWQVKHERDRIYSLPEMSEEDGMDVAELEAEFAEMDGYTAESRAGELLLGVGIPLEQHDGPMSEVAPGWKLRVLLAQALFADPDILLLDEPTNNLDINTIRWLEDVLNGAQQHHDHHLPRPPLPEQRLHAHGGPRLRRAAPVYPGNYDEYMTAATQAREQLLSDNAKKKAQIAELQTFVSRFSANASKAKQATSRARQIEKIELDEVKPSSRVSPFIRFEQTKKLYRLAVDRRKPQPRASTASRCSRTSSLQVEVGERIAIIGPNGIGKTTLLRTLVGELRRRTAAR